jgi:hypothetical protein
MANIEQHKKILTNLHSIYKEKNEKYSDSFAILYKKYGAISALTQMFHKFSRLENLIISPDKDNNKESVEDSLLDLANYCVLTLIEMKEEKESKKNEE